MNKLVSKFFMGTISKKELIELHTWLKNPNNQSTLESYIRDYHDLNLTMLKNNVDEAYNKVVQHIEKQEKPVRRLIVPNWTKYAAVFVMILGLGFFFKEELFPKKAEQPFIFQEDESITLKLGDGNIKVIDADGNAEVFDTNGQVVAVQEENKLTYDDDTAVEELIYNELYIPYGKKFRIELSDGTIVHLNSGSTLKYPVKFLKGKNRQVFVEGEAYFAVIEDKDHPFIVNANEIDIRVLGTEFNVSAYTENENISTVLVSGKVSLYDHSKPYDSKNSLEIAPEEMGVWKKDQREFSSQQVDVSLHTAWIQGRLVFRDTPFKTIRKRLERHYNVSIINNNKALDDNTFNAIFDIESIEEVLEVFDRNFGIKYEIIDNKINIYQL